jgi:hypothetical protein
MLDLTADCFDSLCAEQPVSEAVGALEDNRAAALRRFWLYLAIALVVAPLAAWTCIRSGWPSLAVIFGLALFIIPLALGIGALGKAGETLKKPVLERIAARAGLEYMATDFSPPVYPLARKALFGNWLSSESFTDLFHGADADGRGYAVYEAKLQRRQGKNTHTVFSGQIYALQRRAGAAGGETVIVPDKGIFNFFKPAAGMERVKLDDDEFERRFEVYATSEMEAKTLLMDLELRRMLLDLRKGGRALAWLDPENALVAAWGKDRFEAGSMFRHTPARDRVRLMLEDVCAALATLRQLKAKLG